MYTPFDLNGSEEGSSLTYRSCHGQSTGKKIGLETGCLDVA